MTIYPPVLSYIKEREKEFQLISPERCEQLQELANLIKQQKEQKQVVPIIFICTHNSRRSHFAQVWMQVAAAYYGIDGIACFSGGTEATACNPRTVAALRRVGFVVHVSSAGDNPVYQLQFSTHAPGIKLYSKVFDAAENPSSNFIAVMTCSQADEACPAVRGASARIAIPYEDPKQSDNSPQEQSTYDARCAQIAREMLYVASLLK